MARWLLLTWDGAGNQGPMTGLARHLKARGHEVTVAGYRWQRHRFSEAGFGFRPLPRADAGYPAAPPPEGWLPALVDAVWACSAHVEDVSGLLADGAYDGVVADCLMFGALAALEASPTPAAVLVHSAPGALCPPGGPMDQMLLPVVNAVRGQAGQPPIGRLWDAWAPFLPLCTTIRDLDPFADDRSLTSSRRPTSAFPGPRTTPARWWWPDSRPARHGTRPRASSAPLTPSPTGAIASSSPAP
ncbi:hypothetical protein GCM10023178_13390 [Actinomadura luteofluorescens]